MSGPDDATQRKRKLASERHKARHFAMQALYQWHYTAASAADIEAQFRVDFDMKGCDLAYFRELLRKVQSEHEQLDALFVDWLENKLVSECDPITLALLRIASYELQSRIDVPYKVAINEAVNLAKKFGPQDSHKFVNATLDKVAQQLRVAEVQAQR